ncbi:MFS transporter [Horticoccus sp. 23ND18S-11]|uniref:MFS transporter n=1 Tax=Horticoccus sp. 23ND18S-11 TaxID=3391832 RepID=UPI0039C99B9F
MDTAPNATTRSAWAWIPSLYFAQGIPYVVVMTMAVILYKRLGISNADIALYTSWLYLPWVIKPLWSPIVELLGTKRQWIVVMQLLVGAALGCVALTIPGPAFFKVTLGLFWLLAFASATHDIAADGFYMLALNKHDQAWFVGVRSTFYRLAMIAGQGVLIMLAGAIETRTGLPALELPLHAVPGATTTPAADPSALPTTTGGGPIRLVSTPSSLTLDPKPATTGEVTDLVNRARAWNQAAGLVPQPTAKSSAGASGGSAVEPSWWSRTVSGPLERQLRTRFGAKGAGGNRSDLAGQAGVFLVALSAAPEKDVVVNLNRDSGDKGVKLLEGERFVFTPSNWNKPMMVVVQLDVKNSAATEARFVARAGNIPLAWSITFYTLGGLFLAFCLHHRLFLPKPAADTPPAAGPGRNPIADFFGTFGSFFRKPYILRSLAFLLLYRFAEAQLVKIASLFLLDGREAGGLGLSTSAVGFVYGTVGVVALTLGGLLGGFLAARNGLKYWLPTMVAAINVPNLVYVYLAYAAPDQFVIVNVCVAIEQFGYGFGFAAYMIYMLYVAQGEHQTAHYAICTGFMALGMMIPGMFTGWVQEIIGYQHFFVWVMIATIPGFIVTALIRPDPAFGKKTPAAAA